MEEINSQRAQGWRFRTDLTHQTQIRIRERNSRRYLLQPEKSLMQIAAGDWKWRPNPLEIIPKHRYQTIGVQDFSTFPAHLGGKESISIRCQWEIARCLRCERLPFLLYLGVSGWRMEEYWEWNCVNLVTPAAQPWETCQECCSLPRTAISKPAHLQR